MSGENGESLQKTGGGNEACAPFSFPSWNHKYEADFECGAGFRVSASYVATVPERVNTEPRVYSIETENSAS